MPPLVVIVGETGSGKTALGIEVAKQFNGEVISADSRTVYKDMDIGTAKPTVAERDGIPHFGFDVVAPTGHFNAYSFQKLAYAAIDDISGRGRLPIIVGGTGLYVDAVLYGFTFRPQVPAERREALSALSVSELRQAVLAQGLELPTNAQNPRHLIRLLEAGVSPKQARTLRPRTLVLGMSVSRELLRERVEARVEAMVDSGLASEVGVLREQYGAIEALRTPGYRAFGAYVDGTISIDEAKQQFVRDDLQLAKRQRTWFRRNKDIHWLTGDNKLAQAEVLVSAFLEK